MSLRKIDISKKISSKVHISGNKSKQLVDNFINIIKRESISYDIKISNFGTFSNKVTPQRIGRNPKTGEKHLITERVKLNFIVSGKVKDQLN